MLCESTICISLLQETKERKVVAEITKEMCKKFQFDDVTFCTSLVKQLWRCTEHQLYFIIEQTLTLLNGSDCFDDRNGSSDIVRELNRIKLTTSVILERSTKRISC
jgi:hypothetical protein